MPNDTSKGIILALLTAFISGFSIFYNKLVLVQGIDPTIFNIIKNGGVALLLSLLLLSARKFSSLFKLSSSSWKKLFIIAIIGGSIPFLLYFEGLKTVSATNANFIHKSMFVYVALIAIPFLGEKLTLWQTIGYILIAISNLFLGNLLPFSVSKGELMIFAATLLWSMEIIVAKIALKNLDSQIVAWARMTIGVCILVIIAFLQNKLILFAHITFSQLLLSTSSILFLFGYIISWYKALQLAPATTVASMLILATPITNILTSLFISHAIPQTNIVNILFALSGACIIIISSTYKKFSI